ncbi:MAG: hypothetical protein U0791_16065 [Gemmataceae bacterium]
MNVKTKPKTAKDEAESRGQADDGDPARRAGGKPDADAGGRDLGRVVGQVLLPVGMRGLDGLLAACEPRSRGRQTSSKAADETLRRDNERLRRELSRQCRLRV